MSAPAAVPRLTPVAETTAARDWLAATHAAVDRALHAFLDAKRLSGEPGAGGPAAPVDALRAFLGGPGKRVRPLFCRIGWRAVSDGPPDPRLADIGVGLELLHGHALVHDDVVDRSALRRGRPTVHRACAAQRGGDAWYGISAAVLLGDLAALWADECFQRLHEPGVPAAARTQLGLMRQELLTGQLLDLAEPSEPFGTVEEAFAVIDAKTVAYTVRGPLLIGAAMAGADRAGTDALAGYARSLGEAFQLQDDLEDVTAADTGGEDLREGKRTAVVALAAEAGTAAQRATMARLLGRPGLTDAELAELRAVLTATGAVARVRAMVLERRRAALDTAARGPFTGTGRALLTAMTDRALPGVADWEENAA
ncbi:polyprenyl synthetase family protein [Kitasatospora sp. NPDC096077]|uniref:polyprenyl synthetase family protein n=1 Tax=Kitasatospora sp. NPDC096077 TaxID=3155544 RepID=UPI0033243773